MEISDAGAGAVGEETTGTVDFLLGVIPLTLVSAIIASKGAAGVTGAGLATLAGGLQSTGPTWSTASASSASTGSCPRHGR